MPLTPAERYDRIDSLEDWLYGIRQIERGAIVGVVWLVIFGRLVHACFALLGYCIIRVVEYLVRLRVTMHTRKLERR